MHLTATEHLESTVLTVSVAETDEFGHTEALFTAPGESGYESPYAGGDPLLVFLTRVVDGLDQALSTCWRPLDTR